MPPGVTGSFRIHHRLLVILVDVAPERLGMSDEIHFGKLLEHLVEPLEAQIVSLVLEVHQHRHIVVGGDGRYQLHPLGIALDRKLLLADSLGSGLQILLQHTLRFRNIGQLVGEKQVLARMVTRYRYHSIVPARAGREAARRTRGKQHRLGDAHSALMCDQLLVGAPAVRRVLVEVDHRLRSPCQRGARQGQKCPP